MRVLLAIPDPGVEAAILRRCGRADAGATVVRRCVDLADLMAAAGAGTPADAVVVAASLRHLDRDAVASLHRRGLRVVIVADSVAGPGTGPAGPPGGAETRLGADAVVAPDPEDVLAAVRAPSLSRAASPHDPETPGATVPCAEASVQGRLVAVWGPTGAPGRTTVAVTVADEVARLGLPAVLADADTYGASVAIRLGLLDDLSGLAAACRTAATGRLDRAGLARSAVSLDSGLRVLSGLPRSDRWSELRPAALDQVWAVARTSAAVTVVDCGFGLEQAAEAQFDPSVPLRDGATLATLAAADTVVCVGRTDPVGLVRLLRDLPAVRSAAPTAELVGVLVAPGRDRPGDVDGARRLLAERAGLHDVVVVPEDRAAVASAHRAGRTLGEAAVGSPARLALSDLAARLAGVTPRRSRRLRLRPERRRSA